MATTRPGWSSLGFAKAIALPALWIFLIPVAGLAFFIHAERTFDAEAREAMLKQVRTDPQLSPEARVKATEFVTAVRFSDMMTDPKFAEPFDGQMRFNFATFRWMIRLSVLSIAASVAVFASLSLLKQLHTSEADGVLQISYFRDGKKTEKIKMKSFGKRQQEALNAFNHYWGRYQSAAAYQAQKRLTAAPMADARPAADVASGG